MDGANGLPIFSTGKKRRGRPRKVRPEKPDEDIAVVADNTSTEPVTEATPAPEMPAAEETKESVSAVVKEASTGGHALATYGDQNSAAEGLLELFNAGEIIRVPGVGRGDVGGWVHESSVHVGD